MLNKIFEDASAHYRALSRAGRNEPEEWNAFFYVSSSNGTSTAS
jgi:hypothetical protein